MSYFEGALEPVHPVRTVEDLFNDDHILIQITCPKYKQMHIIIRNKMFNHANFNEACIFGVSSMVFRDWERNSKT